MMFVTFSSAVNFVKQGKVRMLAVISPERISGPVRTFRRCASRGSTWWSAHGRASTCPRARRKPIVDKLYKVVARDDEGSRCRQAHGRERRHHRHQQVARRIHGSSGKRRPSASARSSRTRTSRRNSGPDVIISGSTGFRNEHPRARTTRASTQSLIWRRRWRISAWQGWTGSSASTGSGCATIAWSARASG